ncbi:MAG: hybrid sensor histidine kinase/response regulator [Ignavibacteriae bacterium]|nr:hybrid sensor histidine kinase/response regulator [Ignavibacteriota bacterium]
MGDNNFRILPLPGVTNKPQTTKNSRYTKSLHQLKTIAHDLNNVINNISSGVDLAKEKIDDKLSLRNLLDHIQNNSKKANSILNQILTEEKNTYKKSKISLDTLIDETIISVKDSLSKKVKIIYNLEAVNDEVFCNHTDIYRLLLNLIINSSDALKEKGTISITISNWLDDNSKPINSKYDEYAVIEIKDNGKGISAKNIDKIFEEGYSTKSSTKQNGFGLSIAKEIIEKHFGFIKVTSKINKGTSFKLYIPNYKRDSKLSFDNETVVIAEDDSFQREVLKDLISSLNLNVLSASNGIDVLNFYNREKVDLLIIDKNMPEMNGIECIKEIRRTNDRLPIILATGSTNDKEIATNGNQISRVLLKPYNFEQIQNLLLELLV